MRARYEDPRNDQLLQRTGHPANSGKQKSQKAGTLDQLRPNELVCAFSAPREVG